MKVEIKVLIMSLLISVIAISSTSIMSNEKSFAQSDDDSDNKAIGQNGEGNEASQSDETSQDSNQNSMCVSGESTSLSCNNLSPESIGASVPGEQGPPGPQGETGPQGLPGNDGATGPMGPDGAQGPQGAIGPIGPQGLKGDTGTTGAIGPQGPKGDTGQTGPEGPAGPLSLAGKVYTVDGPVVEDKHLARSDASCLPGDSLISGGFHLGNLGGAVVAADSYRFFAETWRAVVIGDDPDSIMRVQATVTCFDNP